MLIRISLTAALFACSLGYAEKASKPPLPFIHIGAVTPPVSTDALCTLNYQNRQIFVQEYQKKIAWMNLNGQTVPLSSIPTRKTNEEHFAADRLRISVHYGQPAKLPCKQCMDGVLFKKASITLKRNTQSFTIPVSGGCDGGANKGLQNRP